jgi:hypothetical protein
MKKNSIGHQIFKYYSEQKGGVTIVYRDHPKDGKI